MRIEKDIAVVFDIEQAGTNRRAHEAQHGQPRDWGVCKCHYRGVFGLLSDDLELSAMSSCLEAAFRMELIEGMVGLRCASNYTVTIVLVEKLMRQLSDAKKFNCSRGRLPVGEDDDLFLFVWSGSPCGINGVTCTHLL